MGVVYEARSRAGVRAAVKVVRPELVSNREHFARFEREAKTLARVSHRNLVAILDAGEHDGHAFMALEFVNGPTLASWLEKNRVMAGAEAVRLAGDLLRGIAAVHEQGIVHRDLKPANVLLGEDGLWKVTDFGLARREGAAETIALTRPGTLLGTPHYMSPEQCTGKPADARSDLYALGALLYQVVSGKLLFKRTSLIDILSAHLNEKPAPVASCGEKVPPELAALIMKCLEKAPEARPASARAALEALRLPLEPPAGSPGPAVSVAPPPPPPPAAPPSATEATIVGGVTAKARVSVSSSGRVPRRASSGSQAALPPEPLRPIPVARPRAAMSWGVAAAPLGLAVACLVIHTGFLGRALQLTGEAGEAVTALEAWSLFLAFACATLAAVRLALSAFAAGAPPGAVATSPLARAHLRLRAQLNVQANPAAAATALRDLGDFEKAAALFQDAGHFSEAADSYLRAGNPLAAGGAFERGRDLPRALDAYVAASAFERAGKVALEAGMFVEAGQHLGRARQWDRAAEAYRKARKPVRCAEALAAAGRPADGAKELADALASEAGPLKGVTESERLELYVKVGELYDRAEANEEAARFFERGGDLPSALSRYEAAGRLDEVARVLLATGEFARAAELYERTGLPAEATRARAEAAMARGDVAGAAREHERTGENERAADLYEKAGNLAEAARCALAAGDAARAADLFARAGDPARAAALYEKAAAFHEAAQCYREAKDQAGEARALERLDEPVAAAAAWQRAQKTGEALRVLRAVPVQSSRRRSAVALLGDLQAEAGSDAEAASAYAEAFQGAPALDAESAARLARYAEVLARLGQIDAARECLLRLRGTPHAPPEGELDAKLADFEKRRGRPVSPAPADPRPERRSRTGRGLVGTEISNYKLVDLVGEGGTAWVFKAQHKFLGRTDALKVLKSVATDEEDISERFLAEGRAVAALRHPNLIEVHDCGRTDDGLLYIAFELVPGGSLRDLLTKKTRLPVPQAARIGSGLLAAVAAAHRAGIIHRDLKPENVLIAPGDRAKVVDFGIAKAVMSGSKGTATGTYLGTPRYASPEQVSGGEIGPAADQYACGLVLYEMLAGKTPFQSATPLGYLAQHASAPPPPLAGLAPGIPPALASAVMRALAKDPAARHPDAESLRQVVDSFAPVAKPGPKSDRLPKKPGPPPPAAPPPPSGR
jgi:serine/threonine protein kinase/tetratricopeptide (TPR) repeat protein